MTFALLENYDTTETCEVDPAATIISALDANSFGDDFTAESDHIEATGGNDLNFEDPGDPAQYKVNFVYPGTYYLWFYVETTGGNDNSLWYGLDGNKIGNVSTQDPFPATKGWINHNYAPDRPRDILWTDHSTG